MPVRSELCRRDFIYCVSAVGLGMSALAGGQTEGARHDTPVIDCHPHCFGGQSDRRFPYHDRAPYRPAGAATPQHLIECMDGGGVDYAVVVHPEPYQDDHRYLEHCLDVGGKRLKGTCLFFADRPGSVEKMAGLVGKYPDRIIAARLHAYAPDRLPPFDRPDLIRKLWKTAADLGLAMQLHFEPRYAPAMEAFIEEFKDTTVVIDHLGRPFQGTPSEHAVVVRWSRFGNTIMKVSSLPRRDQYPHREIGPTLKQLTDAYGAERMIYGGGFNGEATGQSYRAYRQRVASYLSDLTENDRAQILGGTAARIFRFT